MISELDVDKTDSISFKEFISLMTKKMTEREIEEEMIDAFRVFAEDPDIGFISAEAIENAMQNVATDKLNAEQIEELVREGGVDETGRINFIEFVKMTMK